MGPVYASGDSILDATCRTPLRTAPARMTGPLTTGESLSLCWVSMPTEPPPPPAREVLRVAEHGDGWGVPADWE